MIKELEKSLAKEKKEAEQAAAKAEKEKIEADAAAAFAQKVKLQELERE
jgi:hypothetical protein